MTELSRQARALVDAARAGDEPTGADRDRVRLAVRARIDPRAPAPPATGAVSRTTGILGVAAAVAAVVAGAVVLAGRDAPVRSSPQAVRALAAPRAPARAEPSAATGASAGTAAASPAAAADTPRTGAGGLAAPQSQVSRRYGPPPPRAAGDASAVPGEDRPPPTDDSGAPPAPPQRLERERALVERARAALATGHPRLALSRAERHQARFPDGVLAAESQAVRVLALCDLGRDPEATALSQAFLAAWPDSPLADRVSRACGAPANHPTERTSTGH